MKLKFKTLNALAQRPRQAHQEDVGLDLVAIKHEKKGFLFPIHTYYTGIAVQPPKDYWCMLAPRSSVYKKLLWMANSVGIIDSSYTGELIFKYRGFLRFKPYEIGDRVGQLIVFKKYKVMLERVVNLEETQRGSSGFGSSGVS